MLVSKFEKALESLLAYIKSVFGDQNLSIDEVPQPVTIFLTVHKEVIHLTN